MGSNPAEFYDIVISKLKPYCLFQHVIINNHGFMGKTGLRLVWRHITISAVLTKEEIPEEGG